MSTNLKIIRPGIKGINPNPGSKQFYVEGIEKLADKLKADFPELRNGHRNGSSTKDLAKRIINWRSDSYSGYGIGFLSNAIEQYFLSDENYLDYEDSVRNNDIRTSRENIRAYNDLKGRVSWEGGLYEDAISLKKKLGSARGSNAVIANALDLRYFFGSGRVTKEIVEKFYVREKKKGNITWPKIYKQKPQKERMLQDWSQIIESEKYGNISLGHLVHFYSQESKFKLRDHRVSGAKLSKYLNRKYGLSLNPESLRKGRKRFYEKVESGDEIAPEVIKKQIIEERVRRLEDRLSREI